MGCPDRPAHHSDFAATLYATDNANMSLRQRTQMGREHTLTPQIGPYVEMARVMQLAEHTPNRALEVVVVGEWSPMTNI